MARAEIVIGVNKEFKGIVPKELGNPKEIQRPTQDFTIMKWEYIKWNDMTFPWQTKLITDFEMASQLSESFIVVLCETEILFDEVEGNPYAWGVGIDCCIEMPSTNPYEKVMKKATDYIQTGDKEYIRIGYGMKKALKELKKLGVKF